MSMLSGIIGNASKADVHKIRDEIAPLLLDGETVDEACIVIRDYFVFTSKRLLIVNKQGMTGKKVDYLSIPYRSLVRFSIETAGTFDLDCELKIWMTGSADPIIRKFNRGMDVIPVQRVLAQRVLG